MKLVFFFLSLILVSHVFAQDLEDLLSFKASSADQVAASFNISLAEVKKHFESYNPSTGKVVVEAVDTLPNGALISVKPVINGSEVYFRYAVTPAGLKSVTAVSEAVNYIAHFRFNNGQLSLTEMVTNARLGSKNSLETIARSRIAALKSFSMPSFVANALNPDIDKDSIVMHIRNDYTIEVTKSFEPVRVAARLDEKIRKTKFEARKVIFDQLDSSPDQLKDLVAKNDRHGVAKLVETYLPWEHFEPVEAMFWKEWLEAVRNPVPLKERMFMYRGLDVGQSFVNDAGKTYLLPPVIIKNQGSYNRRLRSLTTMLEKGISRNPHLESMASDKAGKNGVAKSSRLTNQLFQHSGDPLGSPHMSFTKVSSVAQMFSSGKVGIFAIDPRLIIPNAMSNFSNELELLASMAVFPDESLGVFQITPHSFDYTPLENHTKELLREAFGESEAKAIYAREFKDTPLSQEPHFPSQAKKDLIEWIGTASSANCSSHFSP